jgi:hypothetical protein
MHVGSKRNPRSRGVDFVEKYVSGRTDHRKLYSTTSKGARATHVFFYNHHD